MRCPLHDDLNPSASVYIETDTFVCFTCDVVLNPLTFLCHYYKINYREAQMMLKDIYGIVTTNFITWDNKKLTYLRAKGESLLRGIQPTCDAKDHFKHSERLEKICFQHQSGLIDADVLDQKYQLWLEEVNAT